MRFIPATKQEGAPATSVNSRARVAGRITVGSLAAAGAFAFLASGHAAQAATLSTKSKVVSSPSSATSKPQTVNKYVVTQGDTLYEIASRSGVSLNSLVRANGISTSKPIVVGQHLVIPTSQTVAIPKSKVSSAGVQPTDIPNTSARFDLKPIFSQAASRYGVSLSLLEAVAWHESGWQSAAVSRTGAIGIGQLMPSAVSYVNQYLVSKPLDPKTDSGNISITASYLHYLINENKGDYRMALAAYYQGETSVRTKGIYNDTSGYVAAILALQQRYF
jgi:N-acetylmuramoyl-L-alanine amidase